MALKVWSAGERLFASDLNDNFAQVGTGPGATGGGTDEVFFQNDKFVTTSYEIVSGKNAMTAGPIVIQSGVTVTIPSGSVWTVV